MNNKIELIWTTALILLLLLLLLLGCQADKVSATINCTSLSSNVMACNQQEECTWCRDQVCAAKETCYCQSFQLYQSKNACLSEATTDQWCRWCTEKEICVPGYTNWLWDHMSSLYKVLIALIIVAILCCCGCGLLFHERRRIKKTPIIGDMPFTQVTAYGTDISARTNTVDGYHQQKAMVRGAMLGCACALCSIGPLMIIMWLGTHYLLWKLKACE